MKWCKICNKNDAEVCIKCFDKEVDDNLKLRSEIKLLKKEIAKLKLESTKTDKGEVR